VLSKIHEERRVPGGFVERYGQLPLSYYLSAFNFKPWREILIVSEPQRLTGPVLAELLLLNKTGFSPIPMRFQSSSWREDFLTLVCADHVVLSRSSISQFVVHFGQGHKSYFAWTCLPGRNETIMYQINSTPDDEETWDRVMHQHDNSAEEWVAMLLAEAEAPAQCTSEFAAWDINYMRK